MQDSLPRFNEVFSPASLAAHRQVLLGRALEALQGGRPDAARQMGGELLRLAPPSTPEQATAHQVLGLAALGQGRLDEAVRAFGEALRQRPGDAGLWFNLGQALLKANDWAYARRAFDRALGLDGTNAEAYYGRALAWRALGEHGRAGRDVTAALKIAPDHPGALRELANALLVAGETERALEAFGRVEAGQPEAPFVACMRVFLARQLCAWNMPGLCAPDTLRARALRNEPALEPFAALVLYDEPALHRHAAGLWLSRLHPARLAVEAAGATAPGQALAPGERLRVAYISCDFHNHATAYLMAGLFAAHDRSRVEVTALAYGPPQDDALRRRIAAACERFEDVGRQTDAQIVARCRELGVHIAVDLKGLTRDSRPGIFARRAAPVQVNWLGYPGTLPAPYYDYIVADRVVIPAAQRAHYAEAVAFMPDSYQVNDDQRPIDPARQCRADHGLPAAGTVLCCFNNTFKITHQVWASWMRVLAAAPDSVLWLLAPHGRAQANLRAAASAHGIAPERLVFAPPLDLPQHLARLQLADLSLETLPCNAHTTASDALWAGVPHLTCTGESFAARVGASLLTAVGMPELITHSPAEWECLATELANDPARLKNIRRKLAHERKHAPLFDTQRFARNLEAAFGQMWKRHAAGLAPADFGIKGSGVF